MSKIIKTDQEWKSLLTEDEYYVTRQKGTEPPFSGKNFEIINGGIFKCKCCGNELFNSSTKYDSYCGWPSFFEQISPDAIKTETDSCLLYTSPSPRDEQSSRMPSSA